MGGLLVRSSPTKTRRRLPVIVAQGAADPETLSGGGEAGTAPGDRQAVGEVPAILDQDEATPDFDRQRDG
jgi:hypothetical protein